MVSDGRRLPMSPAIPQSPLFLPPDLPPASNETIRTRVAALASPCSVSLHESSQAHSPTRSLSLPINRWAVRPRQRGARPVRTFSPGVRPCLSRRWLAAPQTRLDTRASSQTFLSISGRVSLRSIGRSEADTRCRAAADFPLRCIVCRWPARSRAGTPFEPHRNPEGPCVPLSLAMWVRKLGPAPPAEPVRSQSPDIPWLDRKPAPLSTRRCAPQ